MRFLRQNTASDIILCSKQPITDCVDGKTPVESLTLADITAAIYKGTIRTVITLTASGGDNNLVHIADGFWKLSLSAANLDTVGRFKITLRDDDIFLAVSEDFMIMPAAVYDSLHGSSALATAENVAALGTQITDKIIECDSYFDTSTTPWQLIVHKKGDPATEYSRKNAYDQNGIPITSVTQVIARLEEP